MKSFWIFILCIAIYVISIIFGLYMFTDILIFIIIGCGIISSLEKIYQLLKNNKR